MSNLTSAINVSVPADVKEYPDKELKEALRELKYMERHPDKYKSYETIEELKEALLSDDEV